MQNNTTFSSSALITNLKRKIKAYNATDKSEIDKIVLNLSQAYMPFTHNKDRECFCIADFWLTVDDDIYIELHPIQEMNLIKSHLTQVESKIAPNDNWSIVIDNRGNRITLKSKIKI